MMIVSHPATKKVMEINTPSIDCISLSISLAVTVEFDRTNYTVSESDRYANITIVKLGETTQTVSVAFTTADGSAIG